MSKKIKAKPKKVIKEAEDIILTSIDDKTAIRYLKEIIEDDFPDLDLGRMNLHEALSALDEKELKNKNKDLSVRENLNNALSSFIDTQETRMQKIIEARKAISEKRIASDKKDLMKNKDDNDEILPEVDDYDIEEDDYVYDYEEANERLESDSILPELKASSKKNIKTLEQAASVKKALADKKAAENKPKKTVKKKAAKKKNAKKKTAKKAKK